MLPLPLIKNKKTVNPRDSSSTPVFQLETAMGAAIECFDDSGAVVVPRARFAPVKTCADLLVLRSDAYKITEASTVELSDVSAPAVKLDDAHYKSVGQSGRACRGLPSLFLWRGRGNGVDLHGLRAWWGPGSALGGNAQLAVAGPPVGPRSCPCEDDEAMEYRETCDVRCPLLRPSFSPPHTHDQQAGGQDGRADQVGALAVAGLVPDS